MSREIRSREIARVSNVAAHNILSSNRGSGSGGLWLAFIASDASGALPGRSFLRAFPGAFLGGGRRGQGKRKEGGSFKLKQKNPEAQKEPMPRDMP